jgi:predicted transcriptional regulator
MDNATPASSPFVALTSDIVGAYVSNNNRRGSS